MIKYLHRIILLIVIIPLFYSERYEEVIVFLLCFIYGKLCNIADKLIDRRDADDSSASTNSTASTNN